MITTIGGRSRALFPAGHYNRLPVHVLVGCRHPESGRGRASRHPAAESLDPAAVSFETSPLDAAIRDQQLTRYHEALERLSPQERDLITARLEMGLSYEELAELFGKPSWNAARMATVRALLRLAEELERGSRSRSDEDKHGV